MKKHYILIISFILAFSFFLYIYLKPISYETEYTVNDIKIKEKYDSSKKYYSFDIYYGELDFNIISFSKYTTKRRLIDDIDISNYNVRTCTNIKNSKIPLYDVCFKDNNYLTNYIDSEASFNNNSTYENIIVNELNDKKYLLWNYREFIYLNGKKTSKIDLFDNDIYNLALNYQFDKYLLLPDYDQEHQFDKLNVVDINNGKVSTIKLRFPVYFDSYFLGNDNNKVYLYDTKEGQEYYIDIKKEDIYKTSNKIYNINKWEKVSEQKLKNSKMTFTYEKVIDFVLEDNKLYMVNTLTNQRLLVTEQNVDKIIKSNNNEVYYLVIDTLYYFNPNTGFKKLIKYSEWEFNNQNMIFIFD